MAQNPIDHDCPPDGSKVHQRIDITVMPNGPRVAGAIFSTVRGDLFMCCRGVRPFIQLSGTNFELATWNAEGILEITTVTANGTKWRDVIAPGCERMRSDLVAPTP
jgi:hypothetical protein